MLRKLLVLLLTGAVGVSLLWAAPEKGFHLRKRSHNLPVMGGANDPQINVRSVPWRPSRHTLDDHIGITDTAGTTYYDYQHNGTCGKMIAVDNLGFVSVVWMNGLYPDPLMTRLVYYNVWDPATGDFMFDGGIRIDPAARSGYVTQTTDANGFCYPAFHRLASNGHNHAAVAGDYAAYSDAFTSWEPDWCYEGATDLELVWPKIAMDINGVLHMVSTEYVATAGEWQRTYYSRGIPEFDDFGFFLDILWDEMSCGGFDMIDTVMVIAPDVACSRHTDRVAIAWCHPMDDLNNADIRNQVANEIYLSISEDGGINWGEPINVTQWTTWDPECWYNSAPNYDITCNRDTLRAYTDCSVLLDESDYVHIAFTVQPIYYYVFNDGVPDSGYYYGFWTPSLIYHWSEQTHYNSLVMNGFYPAYDPGTWQLTVQRPNLAIDPTNSYLYCSYMKYDTTTYSEGGWPMADAFVTVSTNGGTNWAVGTNVTNTTPVDIPVPTGASEHERDITVAPLVTDGFLHMEYVFDKDAGSIPYDEGIATLNPIIYQRIPVNEIATTPLVEEYPMHWDAATILSHGLPEYFALYPNYPNPFNPTTTLQFDLAQQARVTLKVYNVLGQEVVTLIGSELLSAGVHTVRFDASSYPSGIYIYRLETPGFSAARKMVLLK